MSLSAFVLMTDEEYRCMHAFGINIQIIIITFPLEAQEFSRFHLCFQLQFFRKHPLFGDKFSVVY